MEITLAVEDTVAVPKDAGNASEAERQAFIAEADALLKEAQAALNDAKNALTSLDPELIAKLEQQISGIRALLAELSGPASAVPLRIGSRLQALAREVHNTSAEVAVAVAREAIGDMIAFAAATAGLSNEATMRVTIRSGNITDNSIHAWARTFIDDDTPETLRPAMARHMAYFLQKTEAGRAIVTIHNATSVEARVAANVELEQQKVLMGQLLASNLPDHLKEKIQLAMERKIFVQDLNAMLKTLLDQPADEKTVRIVIETIDGKAAIQERRLKDMMPELLATLKMPADFIEMNGGFDKENGIWAKMKAMGRGTRKDDIEKLWAILETSEIQSQSWAQQKSYLLAKGHSEQDINDAGLMRVVRFGLVLNLTKEVSLLEMRKEMELDSKSAELRKILNDDSRGMGERVEALKAILKGNDRFKKIPDGVLDKAIYEIIENADNTIGMQNLAHATEAQRIALAQQTADDLARAMAAEVGNPAKGLVAGGVEMGGDSKPAVLASAKNMLAGRVTDGANVATIVAHNIPPNVFAQLPKAPAQHQLIS